MKTLVGTGGGAVGIANRGRRLVDYILEAASEQIKLEIGRNLSIYPAELLADRFIAQDLDRFGRDFRKFLKDPTYFTQDEIDRHDFNELVAQIQDNRSLAEGFSPTAEVARRSGLRTASRGLQPDGGCVTA